jgi:myo-inositol 2-dehydrogenase/D-chiro-inositol 1-dehydrogenase
MLRIGIIGAGRIGRVHGESVSTKVKDAVIAAVADPYMNEDIIKWAESYNIDKRYKDYREILSDQSIDAVLICSSTDTHSAISIEAAKAGKHIFCEKPVDHDINKIMEVIKVLREYPVKYQVGFNRRFDHNFMAAKSAVQSGKIGKINIIKITSRDPAPPPVEYIKVSGGLFLDMAIHDFDMARFIAGAEAEEVFAYGANLVDPAIGKAGDIDTAIISMKMSNGALAVIDNSRKSAYGYDQRLEVFGSLGQVAIGNDTGAKYSLSTAEGVISDKPLHFFLERYMDAYAREISQFIDSVENDKETPVGITDGLMDVVTGLAAKKSIEINAPVKIKDILSVYGL